MASTRFVVDLGDLKVSDKATKRLNGNIQKLVLDELAELDIAGDRIARFPPDWWGIIIRDFGVNVRDDLEAVSKEIGNFAPR